MATTAGCAGGISTGLSRTGDVRYHEMRTFGGGGNYCAQGKKRMIDMT